MNGREEVILRITSGDFHKNQTGINLTQRKGGWCQDQDQEDHHQKKRFNRNNHSHDQETTF